MRNFAKYAGIGVLLVMLGVACGKSPAASPQGSPAPTSYDHTRWREFGMTNEEYSDHIQRTQAFIGECMTEAGFRYFPATVEMIEHAQDSVRLQLPEYPRVEYKKKWGYGATTRFDNHVKEVELGEQNLKYYASLSETNKEAYDRTMWGEDPNETFAWAFDEEDFSSTGGCTRRAIERVFTADQLLGTYVNPKDVAVENDPRVIKAVAEWKTCMEAKGYQGYEDQDELIEEFEERLDALLGEDEPEDLEGSRLTKLKALQQEEIKASLADVDCEIKHTDEVYRQVEIEIFGRPVSGTIRA
jgi:hypothetical protein